MFGGSKKGNRAAKINTLIGHDSQIHGGVVFKGGLHLDGLVKGDVKAAEDDDAAVLTVGVGATIEGNVYVPYVVLDGNVVGDVHASELVELAPHARVNGDIFYNKIEMAMGAEVNGKLVHVEEASQAEEKVAVLSSTKEEADEQKIRAAERSNS